MDLKSNTISPLFSVIVPVYKVEQYLHTCINSVLNQSYKNWELILVDDGSPDDCPQICDEYAAKDKRLKVIHKQNGGSSDARNFGIEAAVGKFLLFMDSDDYWDDCFFLYSLSEIINNQSEIVIVNFGWVKYFHNSKLFVEDKRNYTINRDEQENNNQFISKLVENDLFTASAWNKCIKRQFVVENNLYFRKGVRSEDIDWCGRILFLMPSMTCYNKKPYVYRQQVSGSITASVNISHIRDIIQMIRFAQYNSEKMETNEKNMYLSFFAIQYLTLLFHINSGKFNNFPDLHNEVKELRSILKNDLNFKVKTANKFMKFFGFTIMSKLLRQYILIKRG